MHMSEKYDQIICFLNGVQTQNIRRVLVFLNENILWLFGRNYSRSALNVNVTLHSLKLLLIFSKFVPFRIYKGVFFFLLIIAETWVWPYPVKILS